MNQVIWKTLQITTWPAPTDQGVKRLSCTYAFKAQFPVWGLLSGQGRKADFGPPGQVSFATDADLFFVLVFF